MLIQQEGEEEEEEFYEAPDKIPSSSSSDGEGYEEFPPISADVWILDPSPIQERRSRLLSQMGLADDPSLRRVNPTAAVPRSRSGSSAKTKPPLAARPLSMPAISLDHSSDDDDNADVDFKRCTIRSLDTGREFVVGPDGAGGNLREVGTGRHLSTEEFDTFVAGQSPIVQELMRRQDQKDDSDDRGGSVTPKRRKGWFKRSIENVVGGGRQQCATTAEKETSSSSSSSATADSLNGPQRTKVRRCGKPRKELTGLFMSQEMKAHDGSIWTIRFSLDGRYLASAGEDCVINVWRVSENDGFNSPAVPFDGNGPSRGSDPTLALACIDGNDHWEKKRRAKMLGRRRSASSVDQLMVPEYVFALSEKPMRSFNGHLDDILDLSWSKSQYLLSSSMDKTVRLWHLSSNSCLKTFSHSDYVTCIQFNPVDDSYFISGSLDGKVRIWSIPDRQVVDWNGLREMVTAACYTPDGKSALVGTHKGNCFSYNTSEHSLLQKRQLDLENKKKSSLKKITGFQFSPGKSSEVLITSADSRIRVIDSDEVLVRKFKGFRNTSSQISACLTANGKYVISASEDSHVYVWKYDVADSPLNISKSFISSTQCYEHFYCQDVTVAIPWPITGKNQNGHHESNSNFSKFHHNGFAGNFCEKVAATWPEEKLLMTGTKNIPPIDGESCNGGVVVQSRPAWGMVIVTAGRGGQIRIYQNFGFPLQS